MISFASQLASDFIRFTRQLSIDSFQRQQKTISRQAQKKNSLSPSQVITKKNI
jgi:hypothetical protein